MVIDILSIILILKLFFLCVRKNVTLLNKAMIILILAYFPLLFILLVYDFNFLNFLIFYLSAYLWVKIIIDINCYLRIDNILDKKLNMLINGRNLSIYASLAFVLQLFFLLIVGLCFFLLKKSNVKFWIILSIDLVGTMVIMYLIFLSAILRMLFMAKRLSKKKLIFCSLFAFIPVLNIGSAFVLIKYATDEYEYEMNIRSDLILVESDKCKTKYPILLLHGLCWRDRTKSNYWGRIPNRLIKNGAVVFYGQHDPTISIEHSSYQIKKKINSILNSGPYDKVNIIAHSKGGLDARYLISMLDMEDKVASLTTISAPHRGSEFSDFVCSLPKPLFDLFCFVVNSYSKVIGSKSPDIENCMYQTTSRYCEEFNEKVVDKKGVFYQSFFGPMHCFLSDFILTVPYLLMRLRTKEPIDGLTSLSSAKWGEFHLVKRNGIKGVRGLSHADMIDLRRSKIDDFDITDTYVKLVSDLKKKGF